MEEPAWKALPSRAQALYPWLKLQWKGPRHNNNGRVMLSVRCAAQRLGCNKDTAAKVFHDLQAKGFIHVTRAARLGVDGEGRSHEYELTEIELPRSDRRGGRRLYCDWRPDQEFPVVTALKNNPGGKNGRKKPRHRNSDDTVIEFKPIE